MGNFSRRDTFDKMKHYVGVRLQQGVPIVDADWNEMEDIGKYELRAFLKWFVGNGVPQDNDGFRILPLAGGGINTIVLTSNKTDIGLSSVVINRDDPAAADALGFGPHNWSASRTGSSPAQLTGDAAEPFALADGMTLVISTDGLPEETVIFRADDFTDPQDPAAHIGAATAARVMAVINHALNNLTASVGQGNDFDIQGGDGTPDRAGRCLVEGWDVINESNLKYTAQPLYENAALADAWGVPPLEELELPGKGTDRTDVVYLDVWEREVDSAEDYEHLVHPDINIETCVRLKREWVVRVAQGLDDEEDLPSFLQDNELIRDGHVYYPLARLTWTWEEEHLSPEITDLRLTGLSVISHHDVQQIVADAYGPGYTLDHDGQPNLKVSLREAINALLRGGLPSTPELPVSTDAALSSKPIAFEDSVGDIWVFWNSNRSGNYDIWYKRYNRAGGSWESDTQLTMDDAADGGQSSLEDSAGDIWVFWESGRNGNTDVWYNRYNRASDRWGGDTQLTTDDGYDNSPFAIADSRGDIWVFWFSDRSGDFNVWYKHYGRDGGWGRAVQLTTAFEAEASPFALEDNSGDIWVFWGKSWVPGYYEYWYKKLTPAI
jgi:hypothetical protein